MTAEDTEATSKAGSDSGEVTFRLKDFIARNAEHLEIINAYIQELMQVPYEDNVLNDVAVGKWLTELVPKLKKDLIPLMPEARKYKIDMSTIDVYANLRIEIEKRYALIVRIQVVYYDHRSFRTTANHSYARPLGLCFHPKRQAATQWQQGAARKRKLRPTRSW